jgi:RNA polymerase sigma-70 factor (ECF subfamily)
VTDFGEPSQFKGVGIPGAAAVAEPIEGTAPPPRDFRALYDEQFGYVFHTLRRLGVPERDLEDLVHEVFIAFYRGQASYDPARPLKPWLFGIAFRVASDHRRRAQNRYEIPGEKPDFADGRPGADEQLAASQGRELVLQALATLDLDRRAVFVMHDIDEHSMPEIAAVLSVPINTLYSRLRLAREQFAAAVRRQRLRRGEK